MKARYLLALGSIMFSSLASGCNDDPWEFVPRGQPTIEPTAIVEPTPTETSVPTGAPTLVPTYTPNENTSPFSDTCVNPFIPSEVGLTLNYLYTPDDRSSIGETAWIDTITSVEPFRVMYTRTRDDGSSSSYGYNCDPNTGIWEIILLPLPPYNKMSVGYTWKVEWSRSLCDPCYAEHTISYYDGTTLAIDTIYIFPENWWDLANNIYDFRQSESHSTYMKGIGLYKRVDEDISQQGETSLGIYELINKP